MMQSIIRRKSARLNADPKLLKKKGELAIEVIEKKVDLKQEDDAQVSPKIKIPLKMIGNIRPFKRRVF